MSRRRGQSLAPSLFPFLAVLVCTLGTLILLLALVAQNATESIEHKATAEVKEKSKSATPDPSPRLTSDTAEALLREEEFRVGQLVAFREQQTADLERRRDELTYLEDQMNQLRAELKAISDEVARATSDAQPSQIDDATLENLRQQIEEQKKVVEQLRIEAADQSPRIVIVPHKGPNGTDRRPIYLECHRDGVTIWPEGSRLTMTELEAAAYSGNPLDAALRTIRLHAMQHYGDPVSPYPMLLVRPDGIEAYASARRAMQDWDDQFGYELVPAEVKLGYGKSDPELKRDIDIAIRNAARQQTNQRSIASRFGSGGNSHVGVSRPGGRRSSRLPVLSAAQLDQQGRASGYGALRESRFTGGNSGPSNHYARTTIGSGINGSLYQAGGQQGGPVSQGDEVAASARNWAEQMKQAGQEMRERSNLDTAGGNTEHLKPTSSANTPLDQLNSPTNLTEFNQLGRSNPNSGSRGYQDPTENPALNSSWQPGPAEVTNSRNASDSSNQTSLGSGGSTAHPPQTSSTGGQMGAMASTTPPPTNTSAKRHSPSKSSPQQSPTNPGNRASEPVTRQGRDWALPPNVAGMQGGEVVRSIRAECYSDRFILPNSNSGPLEIFGLASEDIDSATLRLATALRNRIERWGPALPGARWKPSLEVLVHPGGEMRFQQLQKLMTNSGIEVIGKAAK